MATKCENGALYDDAGVCGCGDGHRDPAAESDDASRISGEVVTSRFICDRCHHPIAEGDHSACFERAMTGIQPN